MPATRESDDVDGIVLGTYAFWPANMTSGRENIFRPENISSTYKLYNMFLYT